MSELGKIRSVLGINQDSLLSGTSKCNKASCQGVNKGSIRNYRGVSVPFPTPPTKSAALENSNYVIRPSHILFRFIRGFFNSSDLTKPSLMYDLADIHKVFAISLCESHLNSNVSDTEILREEWNITRGCVQALQSN